MGFLAQMFLNMRDKRKNKIVYGLFTTKIAILLLVCNALIVTY